MLSLKPDLFLDQHVYLFVVKGFLNVFFSQFSAESLFVLLFENELINFIIFIKTMTCKVFVFCKDSWSLTLCEYRVPCRKLQVAVVMCHHR